MENTNNKPCDVEKVQQEKVPTDGRECKDWKSRYDEIALGHISWEKKYLLALMIAMASVSIIIGVIILSEFIDNKFIMSSKVHSYFYAWVGGTFGGIVFAGKWLYHTVARGFWNIDRRLWRILTPHLSGLLALFIVVIFSSDIFNEAQTYSIHKSCGIGFLVGYFSDNAIGKLSELANVFFAKNG